jgi:hypothetical protein
MDGLEEKLAFFPDVRVFVLVSFMPLVLASLLNFWLL